MFFNVTGSRSSQIIFSRNFLLKDILKRIWKLGNWADVAVGRLPEYYQAPQQFQPLFKDSWTYYSRERSMSMCERICYDRVVYDLYLRVQFLPLNDLSKLNNVTLPTSAKQSIVMIARIRSATIWYKFGFNNFFDM